MVAATVCNQIRSHGVWFGKRAVVGAVRVFESYLGATFLHHEEEHKEAQGGEESLKFLLSSYFVPFVLFCGIMRRSANQPSVPDLRDPQTRTYLAPGCLDRRFTRYDPD